MIPMDMREDHSVDVCGRIYTTGSQAIGSIGLNDDWLPLRDMMLLSRCVTFELLLQAKIEYKVALFAVDSSVVDQKT